MELIEIGQAIKKKIALLEKMRIEIRDRAEKKAVEASAYDRAIAITIIRLRNGQIYELDGETIDGIKLPANLLEKIAKGICWQERLEADKAEAFYKSLISNMACVETELSGLQSMNKYLGVI